MKNLLHWLSGEKHYRILCVYSRQGHGDAAVALLESVVSKEVVRFARLVGPHAFEVIVDDSKDGYQAFSRIRKSMEELVRSELRGAGLGDGYGNLYFDVDSNGQIISLPVGQAMNDALSRATQNSRD